MRPSRSDLYLRVRGWVDRDLASHMRPASLFLPFVLIVPTLWMREGAYGSVFPTIWPAVLVSSACWTVFVLWRALRLMRAVGLRGDRRFDRITKFTLDRDQQRAESVLAARRRKARESYHR